MAASRSRTINSFSLLEKELSLNMKSTKDLFSINELIMMEFIEKVSELQRIFRGLRGFRGIVKYNISTSGADDRKIGKAKMLANLCDRIFLIFKGGYFIDNNGEAIITKDGKKVDLSESSSGQQEVIRILQDIFIIIHLNQKVLRVIEEPEAHLFPVAQKQLVELFALMVNYQPENQLIITTHSPYILTVFNHLLFASRVVAKNPAAEEEVKQIVDKDCWLDPNKFSAYSLGNESFPEDNAKYCESIFDTEMGTLEQNYLDTVSEMLGWEFNSLYRIHGKAFKRK
jgi:predicted ATPase